MQGVNVKSEIGNLEEGHPSPPRRRAAEPHPEHAWKSCCSTTSRSFHVAQEEHDAFAKTPSRRGCRGRCTWKTSWPRSWTPSPSCAAQFLDQWIYEAGIRTDMLPRRSSPTICESNYPNTKDMVHEDHGRHQPAPSCRRRTRPPRSSTWCPIAASSSCSPDAEPVLHPRPVRDDRQRRVHQPHVQPRPATARPSTAITSSRITPMFVGTPEYYSRNDTFHIEGGDILNINEHGAGHRHLPAHRARRHRSHRSQHLQRRDEPDRHHPGVQHPGIPRLHAPRYRVHADRHATSSPSIPASWAR